MIGWWGHEQYHQHPARHRDHHPGGCAVAGCWADVMKWLVVVLAILLSGCGKAYLEPVEQLPIEEMFTAPQPTKVETSNFTGWNKLWLTSVILGQTADAATTIDKLGDGCMEGNPVFGPEPSNGTIIIAKLAAIGVVVWLAEYHPEYRNWLYAPLAVIGTGLAVWNSQQECR